MAATNYDELNLELFKEANERFNTHLNTINNSRIIFSGKFGHGKTTFLRWFFDQEAQKKKYNVIRLFPVNYSVASNEDIFEYIKYDIITEMLRNNYQVSDLSSSYFEDLPFFVKKNPLKVIALLVSMIPQVGKDIADVMDRVNDLTKEFNDFHEKYKDVTNEGNQLVEVLEGLEEKVGSIYESNAITKLIEELLKRQKENDGAKETVLIIDDLDRIDPEHIFRILNVFAAHFDLDKGAGNKFGFDKVLVVCDIENIRNIFRAKYGSKTDFNGYIDKFYATKVFEYDIKRLMLDFALNVLSSVDYSTKDETGIKKAVLWEAKHMLDVKGSTFFDLIFRNLVDSNELDLRNIVKWYFKTVKNTQVVVIKGICFGGEHIMLPYTFIIKLLSDIKGGSDGLKNAISNLRFRSVLDEGYRDIFNNLAYIYLVPKHKADIKIDKISSYFFHINNKVFKLYFYRSANELAYRVIDNSDSQSIIYSDDFKSLLINVVDLLAIDNQL